MSHDLSIETLEGPNGLNITIYYDQDAMNPREEFGCFGKIYYVRGSGRYNLGDEVVANDDWEDFLASVAKEKYAFNVYAYIHSGIALSLSSFSDPWDSGHAGVYVVTDEDIKEYFGDKKPKKSEVEKMAADHLAIWQSYLNGECYGYVISHSGIDIESCWGYYDIQHVRDDALQHAEHITVPTQPITLEFTVARHRYQWTNLGDDSGAVILDGKIVGQSDNLSDAWKMMSTMPSE